MAAASPTSAFRSRTAATSAELVPRQLYFEVIFDVTGVSLFEEWIGPDVVRRMADALDACDAEAVADQPRVPVQAVLDLRKFFPICADRGFGLINWW